METVSASVKSNTKTHRRLRKAYCRLLKEKQADKINVSSLTEEADISRATFYLYYQNVDEFKEDTYKYIVTLYIDQIRIFLEAGKQGAQQACKRKNLLFTDDDFDLFSCLIADTVDFGFGKQTYNFVFQHFAEHVLVYFGEKFVKKNKDRFDLFYIGYAGAMRNNFLDYHPDKVYRDILRAMEMWDVLFPKYKFSD